MTQADERRNKSKSDDADLEVSSDAFPLKMSCSFKNAMNNY